MNEADITVVKHNDVHVRVICDKGTQYELHEYFSFFAPNYKFHPKFKSKIWDGKIYLFSLKSNLLYVGLINRLKQFARDFDYTISFASDLNEVSNVQYDEEIMAECSLTPRDYQETAIKHALASKRCVLESPTGSGKSFMIYNIIRHVERKTLVIVPTVNLVFQMRSDFIEYNPQVEGLIHCIAEGTDKSNDKPIVISTWQSIFRLPEHWFNEFDVVIVDEAHQAKATSLINIMEKCTEVGWRIGTTGTVSNKNSTVNVLTLEGLLGPVFKVATTKQLMEQNHLSNFKIKALVLKYPKEESIAVRKLKSYPSEVEYFTNHEKRNRFIAKLALAQTKNTLILFQRVDSHGKILYNILNELNDGSKVIHFIAGETEAEVREEVRKSVENDNEGIDLHFGKHKIFLGKEDKVPLVDGSYKLAKDITTDDDVKDEWVLSKI